MHIIAFFVVSQNYLCIFIIKNPGDHSPGFVMFFLYPFDKLRDRLNYASSGFRPRICLASAGVATSRFISLAIWTTLSTISPLDLASTPLDM